MNKVALITGASSGIGLETALSLLKKGFTVYGAARRLSLMKKIEENGGTILYLDLTDDNSIETCVKTIIHLYHIYIFPVVINVLKYLR